jgi:hypothetical protein
MAKEVTKVKIIPLTPELLKHFQIFKHESSKFENKLKRTLNVIDIIGEIEICKLFELDLVEDIINPDFDAYDGELKVQIKSTRAKGSSSLLSKVLNKSGSVGFDYILLAKYKSYSKEDLINEITDFKLEKVYKASKSAIEEYFIYINSPERLAARKSGIKKTLAVSKFISIAEEVYDIESEGIKKQKLKHPK